MALEIYGEDLEAGRGEHRLKQQRKVLNSVRMCSA